MAEKREWKIDADQCGNLQCDRPRGHDGTCCESSIPKETVNHPSHYGGDVPLEHWKVAVALGWLNNAFIYNCTKYLWRYNKKGNPLEDLKKARWYLDHEITRLENATTEQTAGDDRCGDDWAQS